MKEVVQLFAYLILTLMGIVAPILSILLSTFRMGTLKLTTQYENEKSQSEKNIKNQLKKIADSEGIDDKEIKGSLKQLKLNQKIAENKLSYLNPQKQIIRLFVPLFIAFAALTLVLIAYANQLNYQCAIITISFSLTGLCFLYAIKVFYKTLLTIIEAKEAIDDERKENESKTISLLSALVEKKAQEFLSKIYIRVENENIKNNDLIITQTNNEKSELNIGVNNKEKIMAKNLQIGFIFPLDFMIEKNNYYSIHTTEEEKIVRYEQELIHGKTTFGLNPIIVTPLTVGDFEIKTFIKAENIEARYESFTLEIK